ncbi:hypothetical protein BDF21DRAFT_363158 [Thamnidium elegans]|nr:hypothetical protein BDF21DRAFT_363158 [Thamnidium elegans]
MRKGSISDMIETQANVILALAPCNSRSSSISSTCSSINSSSLAVPEKTRWSCHKNILISSSNYFNSIFTNKFQEAEASIVFLPRGIFSSSVLDDVLYYMYTKSIQTIHTTTSDDSESRNLEILDQLQSLYMAADYLGMDDLCSVVEQNIIQLTHGLVCYCNSCTLLIPQLLYFTGPNQQNDPRLSKLTHLILRLLINDPEKTLPTFWCSPATSCLLTQSTEMESLHGYLQDRLLEHVNKNNAIETLHGCFLAKDRVLDLDWSPLVYTQNRLQQVASKLLVDHFDFYCTKYPKLLSCVDGVTYSFDFLQYLLSTFDDHLNESNACLLYKGIVRNLMCRDNVQRTPSVKAILKKAKDKLIRFIALHLSGIKELYTIDKSIIEQLAQDLVVPVSALLLDDDSKRKSDLKHPIYPTEKKRQISTPPWNIKIKSKLCSIVFGQPTLHFKIGQRVRLLHRPVFTVGTVAYVGKLSQDTTQVMNHEQILGVELDRSVGTNDGSIDGQRYFTTLPNKGIFVKPSQVTLA